ncbi:PdaC/SigV domain-containing protein [Fontibacillus sp. BL9]|uniref:PdaC/SigV domain-containing protein n=1 Tax=Fontibacillus sp. BL9 TaxID=3389971 RepID=UPI00397D6523
MKKFAFRIGCAVLAIGMLASGLGSMTWYGTPAYADPAQGSPSAVQVQKPKAGQPVKVTLKGKPLKQQGVMGEEAVLVPLELIRKSLKIPVKFDEKSNTYTLKRGNVVVQLQPTETGAKVVVDGSTQVLPYEWMVIDGKPYVSVKVLTDNLGYTSEWTKDGSGSSYNLIPHRLNDIKISTRNIEKVIPEASIKVQYPQVSGLRSKEAERKINTLLQARADTFVQKSLKEAKENQPSPNGSPYEYLGNYTVTYNRGGLLSILEQTYAYTGGAHGISVREGLTFRLSDGKLLTLDEVLRANPNFRSIVDPSIAKQLKQTEGYFGGFETIGNNPDFYLKDNGVVIFFQLYDYLPYVFGFPEFYFSFPELGI